MAIDRDRITESFNTWHHQDDYKNWDATDICDFAEHMSTLSKKEVLEEIASQLRKSGATLPAPESKGTIESAMNNGLCIALCIVENSLKNKELK